MPQSIPAVGETLSVIMPTIVALRHNPHIKAMAERMAKKGKCKMAIIGAAKRKLVHLCFGVFKNHIPYQTNFPISP